VRLAIGAPDCARRTRGPSTLPGGQAQGRGAGAAHRAYRAGAAPARRRGGLLEPRVGGCSAGRGAGLQPAGPGAGAGSSAGDCAPGADRKGEHEGVAAITTPPKQVHPAPSSALVACPHHRSCCKRRCRSFGGSCTQRRRVQQRRGSRRRRRRTRCVLTAEQRSGVGSACMHTVANADKSGGPTSASKPPCTLSPPDRSAVQRRRRVATPRPSARRLGPSWLSCERPRCAGSRNAGALASKSRCHNSGGELGCAAEHPAQLHPRPPCLRAGAGGDGAASAAAGGAGRAQGVRAVAQGGAAVPGAPRGDGDGHFGLASCAAGACGRRGGPGRETRASC
jgi:hypothetical protein